MHSTLTTLFLLSTPIHAGITARVWAHFYPNCPGEPFTNLDTYENYEQTAPATVITTGMCANIGVPSFEHSLVRAISVDAELLSQESGQPYPPETGPSCNITVHEVPECVDPPLISNALHNGVAVSECEPRSFAAYSEVWLQLVCDELEFNERQSAQDRVLDTPRIDGTAKYESDESSADVQTPGSNSLSWSKAQTAYAGRNPEEEGRVNSDGHAESDKVVHDIMEKIQNQVATLVSGKHNETHSVWNVTMPRGNGTAASNRTMSRRKLSVLRSRVQMH